jgi:hypothetical protein
MHRGGACRLLGFVRRKFYLSCDGVHTMSSSGHIELTGQDWFWIFFVAFVASVATFGGFVLFLPAYILSLAIGYLATVVWRRFFNREHRTTFVLKVLGVVLPTFLILVATEIWLLPSIYKP